MTIGIGKFDCYIDGKKIGDTAEIDILPLPIDFDPYDIKKKNIDLNKSLSFTFVCFCGNIIEGIKGYYESILYEIKSLFIRNKN